MPSKKPNAKIPIRLYQTERLFGILAPMAGMEPDDIRVCIRANRITIDGRQRGPHQHDRDLLKAEWSVGPFHREILLPENVNGSLANATYGNGILVLTVPKTKSSQAAPAEFTLERIGLARGERIGHTGHRIKATTAQEHRERLLNTRRSTD